VKESKRRPGYYVLAVALNLGGLLLTWYGGLTDTTSLFVAGVGMVLIASVLIWRTAALLLVFGGCLLSAAGCMYAFGEDASLWMQAGWGITGLLGVVLCVAGTLRFQRARE
jgi:hypothetical protein